MKQFAPRPSIQVPIKPNVVQRRCACGGSCAKCQEADQDKQIVRRQSSGAGAASPALATRPSSPGATSPSRMPAAVTTLAHPPAAAAPLATAALPLGSESAGVLAPPVARQIQSAVQGGGGRALPPTTRALFEPRFGGRDLSAVRIHADAAADRLARQMGAEAFTVGSHVFFASGRYEPTGAAGRKLLAHELTHVLQQQGTGADAQARLELGAVDTPAEREADRVAAHVVAGLPAGSITSAPEGVVRRAVVKLPDTKPLEIPAEKADSADDYNKLVQLYQRAATAGILRSNHAGRALDLWPVWERSREGRTNAANQTPAQVRAAMQSRCSADHIVELQVGGSDDPNNLRLLSRDRNTQAGSKLAGQITRLEFEHLGQRSTNTDYLEFTKVNSHPSSSAPAPDDCLRADPLRYPQGNVAAGAASARTLRFSVGGEFRTIGYGAATETAAPFSVNRDHRFTVAGLELLRVKSAAGADATLVANLSPKVRRMPLKGQSIPDFDLRIEGGELKAQGAPSALTAYLPFMSEAQLATRFEQGQLVATGDLTPSLPILRQARVRLEIRHEAFSASAQIPATAIQRALPIPGLTIENCNLDVRAADGQFTASGGFAFKYGTIARGEVTASLDNRAGFQAAGRLAFQIPGVDQAAGEAWIRDGKLGGRLTIAKDKFRFPGVTAARTTITLIDGVLTGRGSVDLAIPGLRAAALEFTADSSGRYGLSGTATGTIPGLRNPTLAVAYVGGDLTGAGQAGFVIPGLEAGAVTLAYARGRFSGSANVEYRRGRLTGRVFGQLSPAARLSGGGELTYQIVPGLTALVGLEIRENGTTHVRGELRLPDPIELFPERAFSKRLFGLSVDIPIFGISFGSRSVGIIANLAASLEARAGIGPGQIRRPRILAAFDPAAEANPASFQASGELYVPAYAELSLALSAGIGASLLIVKAIGGLRATGALGLFGALSVPIELKYLDNKFTVTGAAELFAQPKLRFQLDAFVKVDADLLLTTIELYSKRWKLAAFEWGSDLRVGLRFPVSYTFGEPFRLSLDQLQFIAPTIDVRKAVRDLLPK